MYVLCDSLRLMVTPVLYKVDVEASRPIAVETAEVVELREEGGVGGGEKGRGRSGGKKRGGTPQKKSRSAR